MAREFNFTTATVSDLVSTFGIPMATANDITTRKPRSVAELLEVEGMSTKMLLSMFNILDNLYAEDCVLISPPPTSRPSSNLANIPPYKTHTFNYSQGQMSTRASGLEQHPNPSINYGIQSWPTLTLGPDTVNMPLSKSHVHSERHTIHVQGGRSSKYCDVDEHHPTANPQIMSPLNPGPNLANMPQHRKVAYSEETSVYSPGRVARTHRQVQNCHEQYAPPDIHDRPLMVPSPDSSNMSPYQNDTYSEEIDAYRDMTDIRREVEQCSDLYAPLNPHIRPPMDSAPYPANMHSYKNIKFLEVAAANAQRHQADIYMEGEQPIDHYTYPKSHIRPQIAPCQNPANMTPQTNAKCHEKDAVNVPRQVDIYKKDDQDNDYHEYPQSHVRPPRALGPKPANMSPLPNNSEYPGEAYTYAQGRHVDIHGEIESHNDHYGPPNHRVRPSKAPGPNLANMPLYSSVHKYPGDVHTYAQGHQADTHGKVEPHSNHSDPSNPHVRPPVSSDPNPTNLLYTQNDAQLEDTFVNIAQQMVSLNLYEQCSPYKVSHCTQLSLVPPKMDNLDSHVISSSDTEQLEHNVPQWHDMFEHIPSFDGNDWHAFITVFERHLHRRNPPSPLRLDLLEMKLSGEAFQAYGTSASNISTYEELRDFLQARFGCRITAQIRRTELFNMKQKSDETLVDYASRIKFVAGEGYPDTSNRQRSELEIAAFLQGCRDKTLAERVMQNSHDDLDSALNAMVRVVQNALMFKTHDPKQSKAVRFLRPADDHSHQTSAQIDTDDEFRDFEEYQYTPHNECPPGIIGNKDVDHPLPSLNY